MSKSPIEIRSSLYRLRSCFREGNDQDRGMTHASIKPPDLTLGHGLCAGLIGTSLRVLKDLFSLLRN